jgi:outer membrane protein insertion porin family
MVLVLRTLTEFGFLGAYNQDHLNDFMWREDGLAFSMDGRETILERVS